MTRPRSSRGTGPDTAGAGAGPPPRRAWVALLVLIGVLAWLRIFTTWFAQDDFRWLQRAAGGEAVSLRAPGVLCMSLYFRAVRSLFGASPWVFHALSLAAHIATALLVHRLLARRLAAGLAAATAACLLTAPALFDGLHWISSVGHLLCVAWLVTSVWLLDRANPTGAGAWLAVAAYGLALASKEIAIGALPVMALLHLRRGGRLAVARVVACAAMAATFALTTWGGWQTGLGGAYELKPAALLHNLPAYLAAAFTAGLAWAEPSDLAWARMTWVQVAGWGILLAWLSALIARRSALAWLGFFWFVCLLSPVAMFERQFQFYYLCGALPGLAASVAFLIAGFPVVRRLGWVAAALVAAQVVAIEARASSRLRHAPLPTDFVLRRALIARNAIRDLSRSQDALRARVVLLGQQPVEAAWQGRKTTEATDYTRDPFWDNNVRAALSGGDAIHLMFPLVREVEFVSWLAPGDSASAIAAYGIDGRLTVTDYATFAGGETSGGTGTLEQHLARAGALIQRRLFVAAMEELIAARRLAPDHPDILLNLGTLQAQLGDSTGAIVTLGRALEVSPGDRDARYNLGLLMWRMGRREEARATWEPLLAEAPESDLAKAVRDLMAGQAR